MVISFSSAQVARTAAAILEQYGFSTEQIGADVATDCPALLAAPAIERGIGLDLVERIDLARDHVGEP
jgi:hypothetical protein